MCHKILSMLAYMFLITISYGHAASVRQVTMDEMLQQCQFVFEGTVLALGAKENSQKRIHTYVTFEIHEIIKGEYPNDTIVLSFLGGTVGEVTMAVSDMRFPKMGERGIYFVESLERSQVHPFYGWSQGHFLVETDDTGIDRIMTNRKMSVTALNFDVPSKPLVERQQKSLVLNEGIMKDLVVEPTGGTTSGMTVDAFKNVLHERMAEGNKYELHDN
jgi:hypothetical protein